MIEIMIDAHNAMIAINSDADVSMIDQDMPCMPDRNGHPTTHSCNT